MKQLTWKPTAYEVDDSNYRLVVVRLLDGKWHWTIFKLLSHNSGEFVSEGDKGDAERAMADAEEAMRSVRRREAGKAP